MLGQIGKHIRNLWHRRGVHGAEKVRLSEAKLRRQDQGNTTGHERI